MNKLHCSTCGGYIFAIRAEPGYSGRPGMLGVNFSNRGVLNCKKKTIINIINQIHTSTYVKTPDDNVVAQAVNNLVRRRRTSKKSGFASCYCRKGNQELFYTREIF